MVDDNDENFPYEIYNKKRREDAIYPTCIRNEKHFKGQLNVLVSFNKRDKPWQWMPLKSLKYGQQLLRNFRTYKARQRRKQENSNFISNEMNNIDKVWGNEMMVDQEIIRSSIETKDEEDRVKYVDKKFYLNILHSRVSLQS
ncbi:11546_t:CDS:2, partial [Racocetra persica]